MAKFSPAFNKLFVKEQRLKNTEQDVYIFGPPRDDLSNLHSKILGVPRENIQVLGRSGNHHYVKVSGIPLIRRAQYVITPTHLNLIRPAQMQETEMCMARLKVTLDTRMDDADSMIRYKLFNDFTYSIGALNDTVKPLSLSHYRVPEGTDPTEMDTGDKLWIWVAASHIDQATLEQLKAAFPPAMDISFELLWNKPQQVMEPPAQQEWCYDYINRVQRHIPWGRCYNIPVSAGINDTLMFGDFNAMELVSCGRSVPQGLQAVSRPLRASAAEWRP